MAGIALSTTLLLPLSIAFPQATSDSNTAAPTLRAGRLTGELRLDGRLDEAVWARVDSIATLTQIEPNQGAAPTFATVIKVLANEREIIIGIRALDAEPGRIVSYAKARDAWLEDEDHVRIVVDPFRDGRNGYVFAVNPSGARYDALVANAGEDENDSWDAVWEARTARGAYGWSAEIRIPAQSLAFKPGLHSWGFNVQRHVERLQEIARWAGLDRNYEITQTSHAGLLDELPDFNLGAGIGVRPAVTAGGGFAEPGSSFETTSHASLDLTKRIGSNLMVSTTINTDFAEADVDARRTNLTRFPLFFPEKRAFFLEGTDIFEFGLGLGENVVPFFSRRIGLVAGQAVPLRVGGKINGRMGGTSIGALVARTGDRDSIAPAATMGVLRLRQNVLRESSVGMIATFGDPLDRGGSWMIGPDLTYQTSRFHGSQNFLVGVWGLATGRENLHGDRTAAGIKIDYPNDLWDIAFNYRRIGDGFDPSLGFVPRMGIHSASLNSAWQPRPRRPIGPLHVRQCFVENNLSWVAGLDGAWQSYEYFAMPINCRLESGDGFEVRISPQGEQLTESFDVVEGVDVPAGAYHFVRYGAEVNFAEKRKLSGGIDWSFGGFYSGHLQQFELEGAWKPLAYFTVEFEAERDIGRVAAGSFTTNLLSTRLNANISPDLQVSSFVQYESESGSVGTNTRMRWNFDPLGTVFIVYNHNLADPLFDGSAGGPRLRRLRLESSQLLIKAEYILRY